jgi:hypothetical protein
MIQLLLDVPELLFDFVVIYPTQQFSTKSTARIPGLVEAM